MIDMTTILYCITGALVRVVKWAINNLIIFYGENAYKLNKISTVKELIRELNKQTIKADLLI